MKHNRRKVSHDTEPVVVVDASARSSLVNISGIIRRQYGRRDIREKLADLF